MYKYMCEYMLVGNRSLRSGRNTHNDINYTTTLIIRLHEEK